jgi:hypothetical protein
VAESSPVLLYDGTCGFCAESVQLVLRHDRRRTLRFAALQGAFGVDVRARHPELARVDSVVWVDPPLAGQAERVLVARHRHRLLSDGPSCLIPAPEVRGRFLDPVPGPNGPP